MKKCSTSTHLGDRKYVVLPAGTPITTAHKIQFLLSEAVEDNLDEITAALNAICADPTIGDSERADKIHRVTRKLSQETVDVMSTSRLNDLHSCVMDWQEHFEQKARENGQNQSDFRETEDILYHLDGVVGNECEIRQSFIYVGFPVIILGNQGSDDIFLE